MPGADRVIEYHLIARGSCWGNAIGQKPIALGEGDVIVFPQGDPHVLSSAPGMRAATDMTVFARGATPLPLVYELGGGGPDRARVVCCFMGCDERPFNPHLTLRGVWFGQEFVNVQATNPIPENAPIRCQLAQAFVFGCKLAGSAAPPKAMTAITPNIPASAQGNVRRFNRLLANTEALSS